MRIRNCGFVLAVQELLEFNGISSRPAPLNLKDNNKEKNNAKVRKNKIKIDFTILPYNSIARDYLIKTRNISPLALEGVEFYAIISRYRQYDNKYIALKP